MQYVVYVQVISRAGVSAHTIELHLLVDLGMESSHGARNRLHLSGSSPQNARMCSRHRVHSKIGPCHGTNQRNEFVAHHGI